MNTNGRNRDARGFSLIEVLIAVLVLAIGMLGLGAVFPAIISEQRDAFAAIEGENAAASAEAMLRNPEMVDFSYIMETFNKANVGAGSDEPYEHIWAVDDFGPGGFTFPTQVPSTDFVTGLWDYDTRDENPDLTTPADESVAMIPLASRLFPQPYSGKEPKFVWDIALRREPSGNRLQAAIFVRRIDARIRVPRDYSLSDVLTGGNGIPAGSRRLPVAIDFMSGRPAVDDGSGNQVYAPIQMLKAEVHPDRLDWLVFPDGRSGAVDTSVDQATQVGQLLVDNTGVVRTVVGTAEADASDPLAGLLTSNRVVIVDPPFLPSNAGGNETDDVSPGNNLTSDFDAKRASWVRQVIFTPREPVAVRIVTIGGES